MVHLAAATPDPVPGGGRVRVDYPRTRGVRSRGRAGGPDELLRRPAGRPERLTGNRDLVWLASVVDPSRAGVHGAHLRDRVVGTGPNFGAAAVNAATPRRPVGPRGRPCGRRLSGQALFGPGDPRSAVREPSSGRGLRSPPTESSAVPHNSFSPQSRAPANGPMSLSLLIDQ